MARNLAWTVPGNIVGGGVVVGLGYAWLGGRRVGGRAAEADRRRRGRPRLTTRRRTGVDGASADVGVVAHAQGTGVAPARDGPDPGTERPELGPQSGDRRLGGVLVGTGPDESALDTTAGGAGQRIAGAGPRRA